MASAIGSLGVQRFDEARGNKQIAQTTVKYIAAIAGAVGGITKDPQLQAIAEGLGKAAQVPGSSEPPVEPPMPQPPVAPPGT